MLCSSHGGAFSCAGDLNLKHQELLIHVCFDLVVLNLEI